MRSQFNMSDWRHRYVLMAETETQEPTENVEKVAEAEETGDKDLNHYMDIIINSAEKAKHTWSKFDRNKYFVEIVEAVRDAKNYIKSLG